MAKLKVARIEGVTLRFFDKLAKTDLFTDETVADAFLDRMIHTSHRIELSGESLRKKR
ncbi:MAG: ATP-binding protein [Paludibacter sp.]|nr:ATP-binding protein [Paludibacter sp.]